MEPRAVFAALLFGGLVAAGFIDTGPGRLPLGVHHVTTTAARGGGEIDTFCVQHADGAFSYTDIEVRVDGVASAALWSTGAVVQRGDLFQFASPGPGAHQLELVSRGATIARGSFEPGTGDGDRTICGYDAQPTVTIG